MIAALWSNSNWDDDKGSRRGAIEELEENFDRAMEIIAFGVEEEEEIDKDNPFFAQMEKGIEKIQGLANEDGTVGQVISMEDHTKQQNEFSKYIDQ